jgi:hypothetical protein
MVTELPRRSDAGQRKAVKVKLLDAFFWQLCAAASRMLIAFYRHLTPIAGSYAISYQPGPD